MSLDNEYYIKVENDMRLLQTLGRDMVDGSIIETYSFEGLIMSYAVHKPYRHLIVRGDLNQDTAFDLLEHFHFDPKRPVEYEKKGNQHTYFQRV